MASYRAKSGREKLICPTPRVTNVLLGICTGGNAALSDDSNPFLEKDDAPSFYFTSRLAAITSVSDDDGPVTAAADGDDEDATRPAANSRCFISNK